jgi:TolB-like protein/Tfp pilus assembly protein PilF
VRPDAAARLDNVVRRALAKNRDERYRNATAFAQDLNEMRAKLGIEQGFRWPFRPHNRMRTWLLATGVTAALAALHYFGATSHHPDQSQTAIHGELITSLAVLPLANSGSTADLEYLSDGITDSLINDLSEIPQLKVMSRNSVVRYKGLTVNAKKVAESLRVGAVLTGRMVQNGDTLSVSVELVDARDNSHIWGEQYQRKLANVFDLEQNIARDITEKLRLTLSKEERDRLARRRTNNAEAYQLYLKGQFYWLKHAFPSWRPGSAPDFSKSRDFFQRAIEADPGYALAYAWLGHYYAMSAGNGLLDPEENWPKAEAAFRRALDLDPMLAEARTGLAVVQWIDHRDWAAAERQLRLALQLNPNIGGGLYPRVLASEGRFEEAIAEARRAIDFDPLSIRYSGALAQTFYYARRYEECIRQCRQALELDPNDVAVHEILSNAYEQMGHLREAVEEWRATLLLTGDRGTAAILERAYAVNGITAAGRVLARKSLQGLGEMSQRGQFVPATEYARACLRLGEKQAALRWLTNACDEHTVFTLFIDPDPFFDKLRPDPRFQEIVKRLHVRY